MVTRHCRTCGDAFELKGRGAYWYCKQHRTSRKESQARDQRNLRRRRREARSPAICVVCSSAFLAYRSDAKTCSLIECKRIETNRRGRQHEQKHRTQCIDCGVEVARRSQRCPPCSQKQRGQKLTGPNNHGWKGGRARSKGYVYLLMAPSERKGHRYRAEHIVIWERANGCPLPKGWLIHHLNGTRDDNRIENLLATPRKEHKHDERRIQELKEQIAKLQEQLEKEIHGTLHPQISA